MADTAIDITNPSADPSTLELKPKTRSKKDFQDEVRSQVPQARELAEAGRLKDAIELMMGLEKRARLAGDIASCESACLTIIKLCRLNNDWEELIANISILFKRRSQFRDVQKKIVEEAADFVDSSPTRDIKVRLIEVLRHVAEGKLFLEARRAFLTQQLANIYESEGDIPRAADILQEEQVETYGDMDKDKKYEYLLEQIRLVLAKRDFVRAAILAKKVRRDALDDPKLEKSKIRFHTLLVELHEHEKDALAMAHSHLAIASCPSIKADAEQWVSQMCMAALTLALAPNDSHQDSDIRRVLLDSNIDKVPNFYRKLLGRLTTVEVAPWPLPEAQEVSSNIPRLLQQDYWRTVLHERIIEHNIRVVAGYYTRIRLARLAGFLGLSENETEVHLSRMVTSTTQQPLVAKMDRPAGVVVFSRKKDANMRLSDLRGDVSKLLDLVEKTVHMIQKENMLQAASARNTE